MVTGAGGHLGQALCTALQDDYDVVATYHTQVPTIQSQRRRRIGQTNASGAPDAPSSSARTHLVQADLTCRTDVQRLVEVALAKFGRIDALVNAAADSRFHGDLRDLWYADDYPQSQLMINSIAPIQLASAIHQLCWKDQLPENARWNRSIVNVSSISGMYVLGDNRQAFYGVSKAALNMLTLYLSLELSRYRVRVNAICPSRFVTAEETRRVADAILELLRGDAAGTIVADIP